MITMEMIVAAKRVLAQATIRPGPQGYVVYPGPEQVHALRCMQARDDWKDYYSAVRTLRRLRLRDQKQFKRFSQIWWRGYYKGELSALYPKDGRFGWENTPLEKRLEWFKLRRKLA